MIFTIKRRRAFTLVELALVLAVLVSIAALSWPFINRAFESIRLTKAAEQLQADLGFARVQAMTTGLPYACRLDPATGQYAVQAYEDETVATEVSAEPAGRLRALPEGVQFAAADRALDARGVMADAALAAAGAGDSGTPPILFYPDGTRSEAVVTLANPRGQHVSVSLRGLTGIARVGEIFVPGVGP